MAWSFKKHLKNKFLSGLVVIVPLGVSVVVLKFVFEFMDGTLAPIFDKLTGRHIPGLGFISTVLLIYICGLVASNVAGKKMLSLGDRIISRVPLVKSVYSGTRQIMEFISKPGSEFRGTVLVEYPRKGMFVIGFLTADSLEEVSGKMGESFSNVFVPTTPNPTSGFLVMIPTKEVIPLALPVEDAMKVIVSGGILVPRQKPDSSTPAP